MVLCMSHPCPLFSLHWTRRWSENIDKIVTFGRPSVLKLVRSAGSPNVPGDCPINYISQHLVARADPCDARNWVSLGIGHPGVNQPTRGVKVRAGWMIYDPDLSSVEHEHQVSKKRSTNTIANRNGSFGYKIVTRLQELSESELKQLAENWDVSVGRGGALLPSALDGSRQTKNLTATVGHFTLDL